MLKPKLLVLCTWPDLEIRSFQMESVNMRPFWIEWAWNPVTGFLQGEGDFKTHRHTGEKKAGWRWRQRLEPPGAEAGSDHSWILWRVWPCQLLISECCLHDHERLNAYLSPVYGTLLQQLWKLLQGGRLCLASEEIGKEGLKALNGPSKTIADSSVWGVWPNT